MIFIAILMFALALMGMLLFDMKILFGILMMACAAGVLVNGLVLKKIIQKKPVRYLIFGALTAAFLVCALLPGSRLAGITEAIAPAGDTPSVIEGTVEGNEVDGTQPEDAVDHLKAAREFYERGEYDDAERELSQVPEEDRRTEEYYLLSSDIRIGKYGFEESVSPEYLSFLIGAVKDHPGSLILNYKTGIAAYALNRYITAESYLTRAFELAPEDDPYTPYALAAVYKQWGEDEYAYAFMTIAEKNGIFNTEERDNELLVDWYRDLKDELKETEAEK